MVRKVYIKDIKDLNIIGGQITSRVEAKNESEKYETMKVLVPKAIANGLVSQDDLGTLDVKINVDPKRITKDGDVVVKFSTPYDACVIGKEEEGLLVPSFCAIINNLPDYLDRDYFVTYLNSSSCQEQIKTIVTGATIQILSSGSIKKLCIPVPSLEKQKDFANSYKEAREKIRLLNKIIKLEQEKLDSEFYEMEDEQ